MIDIIIFAYVIISYMYVINLVVTVNKVVRDMSGRDQVLCVLLAPIMLILIILPIWIFRKDNKIDPCTIEVKFEEKFLNEFIISDVDRQKSKDTVLFKEEEL